MSSSIKKFLVGLTVLLAATVYPLSSSGKSSSKATVTLDKDNLVEIMGEINSESVSKTIMELRKLDGQTSRFGATKPIYLFLYTPGGSVQSGLELIEAVKGLNRPVSTVTLFAASMGFQLVQNMGDRFILGNGVLMSHRAAGEFSGEFGGKAPSQVDNRYGFWLKRVDELDAQTVLRTKGKQTLESYRNQYQNEMWITGSQAVEQGYADAIVAAKCDSSLNGTNKHQTNFMGLDIQYETAKCPLITGALNVKAINPDGSANSKLNTTMVEEIKAKFVEQFDFEKNVK